MLLFILITYDMSDTNEVININKYVPILDTIIKMLYEVKIFYY